MDPSGSSHVQVRLLSTIAGRVTAICALAILIGCGGNNPASPQLSPVSISPPSPSVLLGNSQQFAASVNGLSSTAVTWSVNGVVGGNATVGTISPAGLYTAPADLPTPASVTVIATSQAQPSAIANAVTSIISDITVAVVSTPPSPSFIKTSGSVELTSTIKSAGNPDKNVTWSVDGIANGNATVGTIKVNGPGSATYTAPAAHPSPDNVTIAATSAADLSKSGTVGFPVVGLVGVTSLDKTVADPFTPLTVNGSGFDQGNLAISVLFTPENGAPLVTTPVLLGTSTTLQVLAPALFDPMTGASTSGVVDVQVIAFSGGVTWISNRITGLHINALAPVPAGVPVGSMTAALLYSALHVSATVQAIGSSDPTLPDVVSALAKYDTDVASLIPAINKITNDPTQSVTLTTANGVTATLNAQALALSDQIVQALVASLTSQGPIPAAPPATAHKRSKEPSLVNLPAAGVNCAPSSNNSTYDTALCNIQNFFQNLANQTPAVAQAEQEALLGLGLTILTGALLPEALIYQVGGAAVGALISSYAITHSSHPGTKVAGAMGATVLDHFAFKDVPIVGTTPDVFDIFKAAAKDAPPQNGILLSSGLAVPLPGGGTAVTFLDSNGNPGATLIQVPGQAPQEIIDTTQLVLPPSPQSTLMAGATGGTGVITSFPEGIACGPTCAAGFPVGSTVHLVITPASELELQGWGGACVGGDCVVTISSNQSATATLIQIPQTTLNFTGSFSSPIIDHGDGGCPGSATLSGPATMTVIPTNSGFNFSGSVTISQTAGICDDYSGIYSFSGFVPNLDGTSVNLTSGIATIVGIFNTKTFSGTWGLSASIGPDVAAGTFSLTQQ